MGGAHVVHDDVGVALEQRHHGGELGDAGSRCSGVMKSSVDALRPLRSPREASRAASSKRLERSSGRRRHVGRRGCWASADHVVAQPRHGRELHPVGLLVHARPSARKSLGVDLELALVLRRCWGRRGAARGVPPGARSYCPSTLLDKNASSAPVSAPVTLPPMAAAVAPLGLALLRWSLSLLDAGVEHRPNESTLHRIQSARSTTSTAGASSGACAAGGLRDRAAAPWPPPAGRRRPRRPPRRADTLGPGRRGSRPVVLANS